MNIGAVGKTSVTAQDPALKRELEQYDRQIKDLQRKIKDTHANNKLNEEQKTDLIQMYRQQITDLETQKQQRQMDVAREQAQKAQKQAEEAAKAQAEKAREKDDGGDNNTGIAVDVSLQGSFIRAQTAQDTSKQMGHVKATVQGELRIASSDSFLRTPAPGEAARLESKLANIVNDEISRHAGAADLIQNAKAKPDRKETDDETKTATPAEPTDDAEETPTSGHGRLEPGQYLDDEA